MSNEADYYTILGVTASASPEAIRAAFTACLNDFPRDVDPADNPAYQRILQAYKVLSNPKRRAVYDTLITETAPHALNVDTRASRDSLELSGTSQLVYLMIDIHTPEQNVRSRQPLNLCLVIDRSTSMKGRRLQRVISAVELLVNKMLPDDLLSVISFSDRANVVIPVSSVDKTRTLLAKLRSVEASGGTEIFQGLLAGIQEMQKVSLADHTNHLILLTDGHTYGDADQCLTLAQKASARGIAFSAIGIGTEWNDRFLDKLVAPSGGQSVFVEKPEEIVENLQNQIKGLGQVYARNLRLLTKLPRSISLKYGFKLTPFTQPLEITDGPIKLGDIEGQSPVSFLLEMAVAPHKIETRINLPLRFVADIPSKGLKNRAFNHQFQLLVLSNPPKVEPAPAFVKAVRMMNMYRMNEKVWDEVEAGQLDKAADRMRHLSTRLLEIGETNLAQQAYAETQRLTNMGSLSPEGRKKLKYGTRALLSQTLIMTESDD